jgi:polyferredoxin
LARARAGNCSTYTCYKGGPGVPPEGMDTAGCPLYSHPAQLTDNKDCTLCMSCLKACPHHSVELRLRPPGVDLVWALHKASVSEVSLMFLLLGAGVSVRDCHGFLGSLGSQVNDTVHPCIC